jgi:hypothetical protein
MKTKKKKNRLRRVLGITGIVLGAVILLGAGTVFLYTNTAGEDPLCGWKRGRGQ